MADFGAADLRELLTGGDAKSAALLRGLAENAHLVRRPEPLPPAPDPVEQALTVVGERLLRLQADLRAQQARRTRELEDVARAAAGAPVPIWESPESVREAAHRLLPADPGLADDLAEATVATGYARGVMPNKQRMDALAEAFKQRSPGAVEA